MQNISWAFIYNLNSIIKRIYGICAIRGQPSTGSSNETDLHFSSGFVHHVLALLLSFPLFPSPLALSQSICGKQQLCISVSYVPNRLYSYLGCVSLKLSASIRRWFFAFARLTPIPAPHRPHVPPGNYGKQNKNSIFSALLQVFRSKLCPKNKWKILKLRMVYASARLDCLEDTL